MFLLPLKFPALPFLNFSLFLNSISRFLNTKHHAQLNFAETSTVTRAHVLMGERALNYVMTPNASSTVYALCDILGDFFKNEGQHLVKSNCKEMKEASLGSTKRFTKSTIEVFCDFYSGDDSVWTLIESFIFLNKEDFAKKDFLYKDGLNYTDYLRAALSEINPITCFLLGRCHRYEYMTISGYSCSNCTANFYQGHKVHPHVDSCYSMYFDNCTFKTTGAVPSPPREDDFGNCRTLNPVHRCLSV